MQHCLCRYAVFGLGSRAYPNFCTFAHTCDNLMKDLGAEMICPCGEGDELCGQEESFQVREGLCIGMVTMCDCSLAPLRGSVHKMLVTAFHWGLYMHTLTGGDEVIRPAYRPVAYPLA